MGKADIKINNCLKDAKRYADCFNTASGSILISPEELVDMERISEGSIHFPKTIVYYKKCLENQYYSTGYSPDA